MWPTINLAQEEAAEPGAVLLCGTPGEDQVGQRPAWQGLDQAVQEEMESQGQGAAAYEHQKEPGEGQPERPSRLYDEDRAQPRRDPEVQHL